MATSSTNQTQVFAQRVLHIAKKLVLGQQANLLAVFVIAVVAMLLIPIPTFLLDIAFVLNFAVALVIILVTMYIQTPFEFSSFPTVLLLVTLARLTLEISATRSILLNGHAGNVIHSIGEFVVGGNFVVGIIIFLILFIVNFIVVTQGAGRVSEVAARFALDSMPGKQLAVDADLNAGIIDEVTAKKRRKDIAKEADFYATMDGGSKFVKGDAIASIIIAAINIVAGFVIGMMQLQLSAAESASLYTILTIGEGLVSQIPALIISVATGIIVTRADPNINLTEDIVGQLFGNKEVVAVSAVTMQLLAFGIRGAFIPFTIVAILLAYWAYKIFIKEEAAEPALIAGPGGTLMTAEEKAALETAGAKKKQDNSPEGVIKLLKVDQMEVELGYKLVSLIDADKDGDLMERIGQIRRQVILALGLPIPAIRVHDNLQLAPTEYQVKLRGVPIMKGSTHPDKYLAVNTGLVDPDEKELEGERTTEPSYGLPAYWIEEEQREDAELAGYTVATPSSVLATHLTEIVRRHAAEIMSRQDLVRMLDQVKEFNANIVEELVPNIMSMGELLAVVQGLLREQVSIRDMASILEICANFARANKEPEFLSEKVRQGLGRQICAEYAVEGQINAITFHPVVEEELVGSLHLDRLAVEPLKIKMILESLQSGYEELANQGLPAVILCNSKIRLALRKVIERSLPSLAVIAYNEVPPSMDAKSIFMVEYPSESQLN